MRAAIRLVVCLALLVGACSDKGGKTSPAPTPPPPLNKELLVGKWKNISPLLFISGFEFAADGTLKMSIHGMEKPVPGRYSWSGDRALTAQYQMADVRKAYQAAAKAYKDQVKEKVNTKKLNERAMPSLLASARDDLPAEETFQVSLTAEPRLLILTSEGGARLQFE